MRIVYSNIIVFILMVLLIATPCIAETWEEATIRNYKIYIDTDSVKTGNNGMIFYTVKYYDGVINSYIAAKIKSNNNRGEVLATGKFSDYEKRKEEAFKQATSTYSKDITLNSLLYNANEIAKRTVYIQEHPALNVNGSKSKEPDFTYFMKKIQKNIKQNWYPPKDFESKKVVVLFTLNKDGHLISNQLIESSGDDSADREAIWAIERTFFGKLPYGFNDSVLDINFTFSYKIIDK